MTRTRKLTSMAMLVAASIALVMLVRVMIIFPFEYDAGDIPILISGFLFGPWAGLAVTVIASVIQGISVSAAAGPWGILMHVLSTGTFVVVSSLIYKRNKTLKSAVLALVCGALATVAIMIPLNLLVMPIWKGVPTQAVAEMLLPVILPFNSIKVTINALVTFLIYKPISKLVKWPERKLKKKEENAGAEG